MSKERRHAIGSLLAVFAGGLAVLALAACSEPTPYAPSTPDNATGYADQQLAANRYRVTFSGNSVTSREMVENYLLLRAAEVTRNAGYGYFAFDTRDTNAKTSYYTNYYYSDFPGFVGFHHFGHHFHSFAYFPYYPYYEDSYSRPITRYQAYGEIVVLSKDEAKHEPRAMNADDVIAHLRPMATRPQPAASSY